MPELPEVETIARNLREGTAGCFALPGRRITAAALEWPRTLAQPLPDALETRLLGQRVTDVSRRGKYLLVKLEQGWMVFHLRMSGFVAAELPGTANNLRHVRFRVTFDNDGQLLFDDPRKFGRVWLLDSPDELLAPLGPEPFDPQLTPAVFRERLQGSQSAIKPLLLGQRVIAGLGNIYTDETLHTAGIHPLQPAGSLGLNRSESLLRSIRAVLGEGIRRNGASIDWVYRGGGYQLAFRVYGQTGKACPVCGTTIIKLVVGQRGTHICPACQVLDEPAADGREQ
jgi:formamidopyrimidine-DNA glycosylase